MLQLGRYPTPVVQLSTIRDGAGISDQVQLWCKRDDLTSDLYGGNKVRKLEGLLHEARERGLHRIVTTGAVASHHVLATALHAGRAGFEVEAVLFPQPWTQHAEEVVRVGASLNLRVFPVRSVAAVPLALARRLARGGAHFIAPGGSSVGGSLGYVWAAEELAAQIARGELPRPDAIVVALGTGGTVAGLLVGLARAGLLSASNGQAPIELVAVHVVSPPLASSAAALALAFALKRKLGEPLDRASMAALSRSLRVASSYLGPGYGYGTVEGAEAARLARQDGLELDPAYTAKAFAAALAEARKRPAGSVVLYWHTLAAPGPFHGLVEHAPPLDAVQPEVRALLHHPPPRALP